MTKTNCQFKEKNKKSMCKKYLNDYGNKLKMMINFQIKKKGIKKQQPF